MKAPSFTAPSFWESQTWLNADCIIVGAGIVGLNAALALHTAQPNKRILVLERGALPVGASTKNAGFACFGSLSEIAVDLDTLTENEVVDLIRMRWNGLQLLRKNLGDAGIGLEELGSYEVFTDAQEELFQRSCAIMEQFNTHLKKIMGIDEVFSIRDEKINEFQFKGVKHLIFNRAEGQINSGLMMQNLLELVRSKGITVLNGLELLSWKEETDHLRIQTDQLGELDCQQLLICTNGFAAQLLPELDVQPGRAQVLITRPIDQLPFKGCFHMDEGYYYFRNVGNRVLFGGGRNLDKQGETTYSHETSERIQASLESYLREVILPNTPFEIEQRWAGTLGLGNTRLPIVKAITSRVFCAVRMGGMGVAIGSLVGQEAATLMQQ
jgi:glycine/D-amino acid oxidase-like deaminating enzyme